MSEQSGTPRTDTEAIRFEGGDYMSDYIPADFARQLERELTAAQSALAAMTLERDAYMIASKMRPKPFADTDAGLIEQVRELQSALAAEKEAREVLLEQRDGWRRKWEAAEAKLAKVERETQERVAQLIAHRACRGTEHNPENGKLHGCCVVCGVPWPCSIALSPASCAVDGWSDKPLGIGKNFTAEQHAEMQRQTDELLGKASGEEGEE